MSQALVDGLHLCGNFQGQCCADVGAMVARFFPLRSCPLVEAPAALALWAVVVVGHLIRRGSMLEGGKDGILHFLQLVLVGVDGVVVVSLQDDGIGQLAVSMSTERHQSS